MMRGSLFAKIYLTLLASLAFVAIASAVYVRITDERRDAGWFGRRDAFLEAMLPADSNALLTRSTVRRLSRAFDADISIYAPDGRLITSAGRPVRLEEPDGRRHGRWRMAHHPDHPFTARLSDGRVLVARLRTPPGAHRSPVPYLALIAAAIGLAAYPVVRHLTRRLETLRTGVERWGGGALSTRVPLEGRDEVAAVAATFNQAADRIEQLLAAHRALLANASHELRSPLARLRMAIDLDRSVEGKRRDEIVMNLAELDELVEEILLASRLDHIETLEQTERVDLLAIAAEEGARSEVAVSGEPAIVEGDARLLTRLVRNLVQNALRHGAPPVTVDVRHEDAKAVLRVRDHGPGLPEGTGERVFEPFYRPQGRSEASGGWGLGLALVRQIAHHHGATVHHETPAGGGACFVARFPVAGRFA